MISHFNYENQASDLFLMQGTTKEHEAHLIDIMQDACNIGSAIEYLKDQIKERRQRKG